MRRSSTESTRSTRTTCSSWRATRTSRRASTRGAAPLLEAIAELGHRFENVGITGYPESHPFIDDETTIQAMFDKARFATYIVSQICFDPSVTLGWVERVWDRGTRLPIFVGIPGAVPRTKLLRVSSSVGLGASVRFLRRHRSWMSHALSPGGFSPDPLIEGLRPGLADPERKIAGFHVFTFNDLADTEQWRQRRLAVGAGVRVDARLRMVVGGAWAESESGERMEATSPATGESLGTVPEGTRDDAQTGDRRCERSAARLGGAVGLRARRCDEPRRRSRRGAA